ncbi:MAG TPA: hypothetical protein VLE22_05795 [Bryobacteraceae bacterium]|nr:hypothetical protein [Bryobacteraceae bacterium]
MDPEVRRLIEAKRAHPALGQLARRRQLATRADDKHYAFMLAAPDNSERMMVAMNFQAAPQTVEVDLSGVATPRLVEVGTGASLPRQYPARRGPACLRLPPLCCQAGAGRAVTLVTTTKASSGATGFYGNFFLYPGDGGSGRLSLGRPGG